MHILHRIPPLSCQVTPYPHSYNLWECSYSMVALRKISKLIHKWTQFTQIIGSTTCAWKHVPLTKYLQPEWGGGNHLRHATASYFNLRFFKNVFHSQNSTVTSTWCLEGHIFSRPKYVRINHAKDFSSSFPSSLWRVKQKQLGVHQRPLLDGGLTGAHIKSERHSFFKESDS